MSPPVRILSLLVLIAGLAPARPALLGAGTLVLLLAWGLVMTTRHRFEWAGLWNMLRRVRWLLLALLILYGGFTPGNALIPALGDWSPTDAGLREGLLRVAVLLEIVGAVYLLLASTTRVDLIAGLLWFGGPVRRLGFDDRRFAVRLILALEAVPQVQDLAREALTAATGTSRLARLADAGTRVFSGALRRAAQGVGTMTIPDRPVVRVWEWLVPGTLILLFVALYGR